MRLRPRDWFALLGFVSFGLSLLSGQNLSLASVHGTPVAAPQRHALSSDGMSGGMKPPESLRLNMDGRDIVTIYETGNVRLADDLSVDEASREFWRKVGELAPDFCRARAASVH